jgi:hypothetical protein
VLENEDIRLLSIKTLSYTDKTKVRGPSDPHREGFRPRGPVPNISHIAISIIREGQIAIGKDSW